MSENKISMEKKCDVVGQLWLSYYNNVLYEKGLITEQERNRMALKISDWKAPTR